MKALRKLLFFIGALLAVATVDPSAHAGPILVPSVTNTSGLPTALKQSNSAIIDRPGLFDGCEVPTQASDGTKVTDNIWMYQAFTMDCTGVRLVLVNYYCNPNEVKGANPVVYRAALDYPAGTYYQFLWNGSPDVVVQPGGAVISDPIPIQLLASVGFCHTRLNVSVAAPPSALAAVGSASGGTLAAATYFYKVTTITAGAGESSALTEVSYTATGSTSSVALTWTEPAPPAGNPLTPISYRIYRGTATNTETLVTTIPAGSVGYTDTGSLTPGSITVPAARTWPICIVYTTSGSDKGDVASTTYSDLTTSGTITTNSGAHTAGPMSLVAFPSKGTLISNIGAVGTSIGAGYNDAGSTNGYGFINRGILAAGKTGRVNVCTPSDGYGGFNTFTNSYRRLSLLESCNYVIVEEGANDFGNSPVDLLAYAVGLQKQLFAMGKKVVHTTLVPRVGTTDQGVTVANQTSAGSGCYGTYLCNGSVTSATSTTITVSPSISTFTASKNFVTILTGTGAGQVRLVTADTTTVLTVSPAWTVTPDATSTYGVKCARVEYNDWVRAGCPVDGSGAATPSGSAVVNANPYGVSGYLEIADLCETSRNSGFWASIPGGANSTGTATSATSTTITDSGKTWTTNQWSGYYVTITAGTGAGQKGASISSNTATTITVASWPTTTPDATSQYAIVKGETVDGIHPSANISPTLAGAITTAINNGVFAAYRFAPSVTALADMLTSTVFHTRRTVRKTY